MDLFNKQEKILAYICFAISFILLLSLLRKLID